MMEGARKILLVEDDAGHARLIEKRLRRGGVSSEIIVATDGQSALDYLFGPQREEDDSAQPPELVILDLNLPVVDGLQVLRRIKADENTRRIPVIVVTTSDSPQEIAQCHQMGCSDFLTKPVDYEEFSDVLARLGLTLSPPSLPEDVHEDAACPGGPAMSEDATLRRPVNQSGARILYIEDDAGLARLLQKRLQKLGYAVDTASGGEEGLQQLGRESYSVLLLDYVMPGFGGLDVIRTLREQDGMIPTIMVTGHGNEKVAVEAMKLGAADYVVKDVDMGYLELLPIVIDQVLHKQRLERERAEMIKTLRESEERYRLLVELTLDAICICENGRFSFVNTAGLRLLGASLPGDLLGKPVDSIIHPDCAADFREKLGLLDRLVSSMSWMETKVIRPDGTVLDAEIAAVPFTHGDSRAVQIIVRDITQIRVAAQRLEYLAHYDVLTGLPNRMLFYDRLSTAIELARRDLSGLALLFVDLDRFKNINDTFGHEFGDLLLRQVASRIRRCVRKSDTVARIGGDEFTVIMTKVSDAADAGFVARKILGALCRPFMVQDRECLIGGSVGIGLFPKDGEDTQALLRAADVAMYRAKERGGNSYHYHD